jgi:hypothetical protein
MSNSKEAKARAEASFKRKEQQANEGAKAWAEYQAERRKDGALKSTSIGERGRRG